MGAQAALVRWQVRMNGRVMFELRLFSWAMCRVIHTDRRTLASMRVDLGRCRFGAREGIKERRGREGEVWRERWGREGEVWRARGRRRAGGTKGERRRISRQPLIGAPPPCHRSPPNALFHSLPSQSTPINFLHPLSRAQPPSFKTIL